MNLLLCIKGNRQQCVNYWCKRRWMSIHATGDTWVKETPEKRCLINRGEEKDDRGKKLQWEKKGAKRNKKKNTELLMKADGRNSFADLYKLSHLFTRFTRNVLRLPSIAPGYQRSRCASVNWIPNLLLCSQASRLGDSFEEANSKASRACWISRCIILWLSGKRKAVSGRMKYWSRTRSAVRRCFYRLKTWHNLK